MMSSLFTGGFPLLNAHEPIPQCSGGDRGPLEMDDSLPPSAVLPTLGETDADDDAEDHTDGLHSTMRHFSISLEHVSRDTLPDSSTANLVPRYAGGVHTDTRVSVNVHDSGILHPPVHGSLDSISQESQAAVLTAHARTRSTLSDNNDHRGGHRYGYSSRPVQDLGQGIGSWGEAPPYEVAVAGIEVSSVVVPNTVPELSTGSTTGDSSSRFSFLRYPFMSHSRSNRHTRVNSSTSTRSFVSTFARTRTESACSLPCAERNSHRGSTSASMNSTTGSRHALTSPSLPSLSVSTLSISAPLPHTLTRAEFRVPRGGLTPEQIRTITARDAPERFGRPYGPAACAFAAGGTSDEPNEPPPGFEEAIRAGAGAGMVSVTDADRQDVENTRESGAEPGAGPSGVPVEREASPAVPEASTQRPSSPSPSSSPSSSLSARRHSN